MFNRQLAKDSLIILVRIRDKSKAKMGAEVTLRFPKAADL